MNNKSMMVFDRSIGSKKSEPISLFFRDNLCKCEAVAWFPSPGGPCGLPKVVRLGWGRIKGDLMGELHCGLSPAQRGYFCSLLFTLSAPRGSSHLGGRGTEGEGLTG